MQITKFVENTNVIMNLSGRFDTTTEPVFRKELDSMDFSTLEALTLDLKELSYISSVGLRGLLSLKKKMGNRPKFMVFVGQHTFSILLVHVPLSRFIFRFFALPTPSITPTEFNPITILVCIVTLAIQCLAIFAIEQIKKRMQAKKNEVQSMAA